MIRLLIWLGIIYLLYRTLRRSMQIGHMPTGSDPSSGPVGQTDDLMVKDPYCGVYFLRKDGHHLNWKGEDLYFCSPECRDKFHKEHTDTNP